MRKLKENIWFYMIFAAMAAIVLGLVGTSIYCWASYGGKPIGEIPGWALWFMFGK